MLKPKLFTTLKDYSKKQFTADLTAGVIVGIVALPLAIAFAIASGVTPEKGLITAVIAGFLISFLGGSRVQIGGPTGAFIVIVYGVVQQYGTNGLILATLMAGIILMIMGFARFGSIIKFIPHPVIVGFTSGIALIIFLSQVKDFLGLNIDTLPSEFFGKIIAYSQNFFSLNYWSLFIGLLSLGIIILFPRITHRVPGSIVAIIVATVLVQVFHLPVETIGSRFGEIPSSLPSPTLPDFDFEVIRNLISPATTIAILAAIESLLSAVVADGMIGGRHRSNMELVAQGAANIVVPLFGGIPATGAIARTATNIKNGGRTPVAGIVHALVLLLIMLFFGQWAKHIPMAALAAVLIIVAYNMSEWRSFVEVFKYPKSDIVVLLTTFLLTIVFDLTIAIQIGMILAVLLFMRRMAIVTNVGIITRELKDEEEVVDVNSIQNKKVPDGVEVFEINGPFFFGAVSKFRDTVRIVENPPGIIIIRMRDVPAIDSTGIHALEQLLKESKKHGTHLVLSGVHTQPLMALAQAEFISKIGEENVHGNIDDALDRAREILGLPKLGRPADFVPVVAREKKE
jgi:sulfate permease, SulP family